jgi:hypothetical protein
MSDASPYHVQRVSRRPIPERNPLVGARELDEPYGNVQQRGPDVLVVPEYAALEFIPPVLEPGRAAPAVHASKYADRDAQSFFRAVLSDSLEGYELVLLAKPALPDWANAIGLQPVQVHASVGNRQLVLRRTAP